MTYQSNEKSSEMPVFSTTRFSGQAENMIKMTTDFQSKFVEAGKEVHKETLGFFQSRFDKDVKFASEIMKLSQPSEVMSFYLAFFQEALDDYSREVVKMGDFGAKIAQNAKNEVAEATQPEADPVSAAPLAAALMNEQPVEDGYAQEYHEASSPVADSHGDAAPLNDQYGAAPQQDLQGEPSYNETNGENGQFSQPYTH